ncbi:MAG TPA: adenosylcobinamide-phosphate synthase CbiB [Candidatus Binatia bacterium]
MPLDAVPSGAALALALVWDAALGEPPARLHPVVWMGRAVAAAERLAPSGRSGLELAYGAALAALVPGAFTLGAALLLGALAGAPLVRLVVEAWLLKSTFALRALGDAAQTVRRDLASGDLDAARRDLMNLCSRDANALDEPLVAAAAVESVAENASDSFVAPLLAYAVLGLPGAVFYRAVNTLDAMVGYHGRYEHLGKASARFDDLLNLIPARLTAALLVAAAWLTRRDARAAARIALRDARGTESPNAGWPMSAMAGALGVALEKVGHYRLGDARAPLRAETIDAAWRLTLVASVLAALLAFAGLGIRRAVAG